MTKEAFEETEISIRRALACGDHNCAVTIGLEAYGAKILGLLHLKLRDPVVAKETYAQFNENLFLGIRGFRDESSFRTWAYRIAHNAAAHYLRAPFRRRGRRLSTGEGQRIPADSDREPTPVSDQTTARRRVLELGRLLAPDDQVLLSLRIDQKMSFREIACVIDQPNRPLTEVAARKRYQRVKQRLRELATEAGLLRSKAQSNPKGDRERALKFRS